jgi:hypothetical protein
MMVYNGCNVSTNKFALNVGAGLRLLSLGDWNCPVKRGKAGTVTSVIAEEEYGSASFEQELLVYTSC